MVDISKEVVAALRVATGLEVYYELMVDSTVKLPAITYTDYNNFQTTETGNTLGYNTIEYQIKLWGYDVAELVVYAAKIDEAMRSLGFKRTTMNTIVANN